MDKIKTFCLISLSSLLIFTPSCTQQKEGKYIWVEEICPHCKGTGKVKASTATKVYLGIISLGSGATIQTEPCEFCHGSGITERRIINKSYK